MLPKIDPSTTKSWYALEKHFRESIFNLRHLFQEDPKRFEKFSVRQEGYVFDYSKNLITEKTLELLLKLAEECRLKEAIEKMFSGDKINETERRGVLHTALRDFSDVEIELDRVDVKQSIQKVLDRMKLFSEKVISGDYKGFSGKKITDIVNIGIGGSHLGPLIVCNALKHFKSRLNVHFLSNIDTNHLVDTLERLNPETSLFIVASKTFTTEETMTNAFSVRDWFLKKGEYHDIKQHFVALSANIDLAKKFGISENNIFEFWDWVSGRYSLWGSIGLSIALAIGYENFEQLLRGAYNSDLHFRRSPFRFNIPVLMGLLGIWYRNFFKTSSHAVLPYSEYLNRFPDYLQQADMESSGKSFNRKGEYISSYKTGTVVWGQSGTNGQHAFYQLIHQGKDTIPCDFIAYVDDSFGKGNKNEKLLTNFFAQTRALAFGKSREEVFCELKDLGKSDEEIEKLIGFKIFSGNIPTNSFLFKKLTPFSLGELLALYEHKIFVQGVVWNIFSFDQWGVELGKVLTKEMSKDLSSPGVISSYDSSTNALINYYKSNTRF